MDGHNRFFRTFCFKSTFCTCRIPCPSKWNNFPYIIIVIVIDTIIVIIITIIIAVILILIIIVIIIIIVILINVIPIVIVAIILIVIIINIITVIIIIYRSRRLADFTFVASLFFVYLFWFPCLYLKCKSSFRIFSGTNITYVCTTSIDSLNFVVKRTYRIKSSWQCARLRNKMNLEVWKIIWLRPMIVVFYFINLFSF